MVSESTRHGMSGRATSPATTVGEVAASDESFDSDSEPFSGEPTLNDVLVGQLVKFVRVRLHHAIRQRACMGAITATRSQAEGSGASLQPTASSSSSAAYVHQNEPPSQK
jgi:plastocyanin